MKQHAINVQSHSVILLPSNKVQIIYTNDGKTAASDRTLTSEQIRDPINGFGEFPHGQATLDKLNVISSFERKLLNTPIKIYLDKSPGFQPYLARDQLPRTGWVDVGRTGQATVLNNGKQFAKKLTDVPPEIAADMFEDHDEPELANALRLQSGLFKKLQLNS